MSVSPTVILALLLVIVDCTLGSITVMLNVFVVVWYFPIVSVYTAVRVYVPALVYLLFSLLYLSHFSSTAMSFL